MSSVADCLQFMADFEFHCCIRSTLSCANFRPDQSVSAELGCPHPHPHPNPVPSCPASHTLQPLWIHWSSDPDPVCLRCPVVVLLGCWVCLIANNNSLPAELKFIIIWLVSRFGGFIYL